MRGIALDDVWHDHSECPLGQSIALPDRVLGKGRAPKRCTYCAMLDHRPQLSTYPPSQ
jgi:hypothetical protein